MATNGAEDSGHGCALLLASAPPGRHRVMDTGTALPLLATVAPRVLTGSPAGGNVVQLVDPVDANTVSTHLRTAAATPGPLLVHVCGQVTVDRRQRLPHLVLARSTPATVRYTGFPWHWLAAALRQRPPGTTTVLCDLIADETAWAQLAAEPGGLAEGLPLYGVLAPPPPKRAVAPCAYSKAVAELLRAAGERPPAAVLHDAAVSAAGLTGREVVFRAHQAELRGAPVHGPASAVPVEGTVPGPPSARAVPAPAEGPGGGLPLRGAVTALAERRAAEHTRRSAAPAAPAVPAPAPIPEPGAGSAAQGAAPAPTDAAPAPEPPPSAPGSAAGAHGVDPHVLIRDAARAGRHGEAAAIAAAWEQAALRAGGPGSKEALHWVEVRADLAMLAGDTARACELWMTAASARLGAGQDPESESVINAVDRAHHCWTRIADPDRARAVAPDLLTLRRRVAGRQPGALRALEQRLDLLGGHPA